MWITYKKRYKRCRSTLWPEGMTLAEYLAWRNPSETYYEWIEISIWLGKKKFQKKSHHKKKVKSEAQENKEAWRKHKGVLRDKAKRQGIVNRCFGDGPPPWLKRNCNKKHRQWERHCIEREEYDKMHKKDLKRFLNPWRWY